MLFYSVAYVAYMQHCKKFKHTKNLVWGKHIASQANIRLGREFSQVTKTVAY